MADNIDLYQRKKLVQELKKLKDILHSNDSAKIASIFLFPLSDTAFSIYIDDSAYLEQYKIHNNTVSRSMFLQYYQQLSASIWVDQVNKLFYYINPDSLLTKTNLEYDDYIKTDPCYYSDKIEMNKDSLVLRIDMKSNRSYVAKETSEGDIPENASENCEHSFWWVLKFNSQRLYVASIMAAD